MPKRMFAKAGPMLNKNKKGRNSSALNKIVLLINSHLIFLPAFLVQFYPAFYYRIL